MLLYSKEAIDKTSEWIDGNPSAKYWLLENNFEELVLLKDAACRHTKAIESLLIKKHFILVTFVSAVWDDKKAFALLMDKKEFIWAAMANFINGDDKAAIFLKNSKLQHFAELAFKIQTKIKNEGDKGTNFFRSGPYKP